MDIFGANMTFPERAGLVFVIAACMAGLIVFTVYLLKKMGVTSISVPGGDVKLDSALSVADRELNDRGREAVIEVSTLALTTATDAAHLRTKQVLSDQMYYLEDKLTLIMELLTTAYRGCLAAKLRQGEEPAPPGEGNPTSHNEFHFFTSLVTLMSEDLKKAMRQIFLKNHFSHYDEREFAGFLKEKVDLLSVRMLQFLRDLYPSDKMVVSVEEVENTVFKGNVSQVTPHLEHAFRRAVQIHRARHEEADRKEQQMKSYILNVYGVDIDAPRKHYQEARKNG